MKRVLSFLILILLSTSYMNIEAHTNTDNLKRDKNILSLNEDLLLEEIEMTEDEYYISREASISKYNNIDYNELINTIYKGLIELNDEIDIIEYCNTINDTDLKELMSYYFNVLREYPEIFYGSNKVNLDYSYNKNSGIISKCNLKITYIEEKSKIIEMRNKFNNKVNEIRDKYLNNITDKVKLQYIIHDYLLENTVYDHDNYINNTVEQISYTAYGPIINGVAVCDGYSKAAKLFFNMVGIESGIVRSPEMNHSWNYVNINNEYYHMDISRSDMISENNKNRYYYFNMSDNEMLKSHKWDRSLYPECKSDKFSFLRKNNNDVRIDERLYYFSNNNLYSISLCGDNNIVESNNTYGKYLVSYEGDLLFVNSNNEVIRYNINTKIKSNVYKAQQTIDNLYVKNNKVYITIGKYDKAIDPTGNNNQIKNGWILNGSSWNYYMDDILYKGWLNYKGAWYYLKANGDMATGWVKDSGKWYYMNSSGAMKTGWLKDDGFWYYLKANGDMATGWVKDSGKWYYMNSSGAMKTGWLKDGGFWYYLKADGDMATGWVKDSGKWYYMNSSGTMKTGWLKYGGNWYYLYSSGEMATNAIIDDWHIDGNGIGKLY